jgi:hypothetical protein
LATPVKMVRDCTSGKHWVSNFHPGLRPTISLAR